MRRDMQALNRRLAPVFSAAPSKHQPDQSIFRRCCSAGNEHLTNNLRTSMSGAALLFVPTLWSLLV